LHFSTLDIFIIKAFLEGVLRLTESLGFSDRLLFFLVSNNHILDNIFSCFLGSFLDKSLDSQALDIEVLDHFLSEKVMVFDNFLAADMHK